MGTSFVPLPLFISPASPVSLILCVYTRPAPASEPSHLLLFLIHFYKEQHGLLPQQLVVLYTNGIFSVKSSQISLFKITTSFLLSTIPFPTSGEKRRRMNWESGKGISPYNNSTYYVFKNLHILSIKVIPWKKNFFLLYSLLCSN